jgi:hypothetical protein
MKESELDELDELLKSLVERVKREPGFGREILIGAGILNEDGELREHYKALGEERIKK